MKKRLAGMLVFLLLLCGCGQTEPEVTPTTTAADTTLITTVSTSSTSGTNTTGATSSSTLKTSLTMTESGTTAPTSEKRSSGTTVTTKTVATAKTTTTCHTDLPTEMRGAWVSFLEVDHLLKNCTVTQAKTNIDNLFDKLCACHINTVFFHVRAHSDAYYVSSLFKYAASANSLIQAGFDPLAYAVSAAHKRKMQLHAWVNPYRVGSNSAYIVGQTPTFKDRSGSLYYYVPSSSVSQTLIINGIREIVTRYDVDGIQFDDYFYPEQALSLSTVYSFEAEDYAAYKNNGGKASVADWRRLSVDSLIASVHTVTAAQKCIFGISPSFDADDCYENMYANVKKWLAGSGYVDYICPQLYIGFDNSNYAFDDMADTWIAYSRHSSVKLYFGLALYKAGLLSDPYAGTGKTEWTTHTDILKRQIQYLRKKKITGFSFYSSSYFSPETVAGLSSTNDVSKALQEISSMMDVL